MLEANTATLEVLEAELEKEVERWNNSAIKVGQLLSRIKDSGTYQEAGYRYFQTYYRDRWQVRIGRAWTTAQEYIRAARSLEEMEGVEDLMHPVTDVRAATVLAAIEDPAGRVKIWHEHVESGERRAGYENLTRRVKEYKGEPVVRDVLAPEDMANLPPKEMPHSLKLYHRTAEIAAAVERHSAAEVAAYQTNPKLLQANIEWAERISSWYAEYADELRAMHAQPLRAVGEER